MKRSWMTRLSLWYLKRYEEIIHFCTGFSWVLAIALLYVGIGSGLGLGTTIYIMFCAGIIFISAICLFIKASKKHLFTLTGDAKKEAHAEMVKIIFRRIGH